MCLCCRSKQCLQLAQDQAAVRRLSRYVNSDSAAAHALLPEQPRARSCYATVGSEVAAMGCALTQVGGKTMFTLIGKTGSV